MPSADTRSLAHFRRGEPARLVTGPAWTGDLEAFRRKEPAVGVASGMARTVTGVGAIASAEAFGALGFLNVNTLTPTSIASAEALGTPGLQATITISAVGAIPSGEQFGSQANQNNLKQFRRGEVIAFVLGKGSNAGLNHFRRQETMRGLAAYGQGYGPAARLSSVSFIAAVGAIASAEALGTPIIAGPISGVGGIASLEALGTPTIAITSAPRHRPIAATVARVRVPAGEIAR